MKNSFIGSPIERREDLRFLRGRGEYVDDLARRNVLHAAILRSSVAHGRIRSIDTAPARALPGVHSVITAKDIGNRVPRVPMRLQPLPDFEPFGQPVIAETKVRHVGEAIALVLAESPGIAEDAVGLIEVEIEALPAVADRHVSAKNESLLFEETGTQSGDQVPRSARRCRGGVQDCALYAARELPNPAAHGAPDGAARPAGRMGRGARPAHRLGRRQGAVLQPPYPGEAARSCGRPGRDRRERRRRRLRRARRVLSGGFSDPVRGAADRAAREMDRGPPREPDVHEPRARGGMRCRDRLHARRHHPGAARPRLCGRRRLYANQRRGRRAQRGAVHVRPLPDREHRHRRRAAAHQQDAGRHLSRAGPLRDRFLPRTLVRHRRAGFEASTGSSSAAAISSRTRTCPTRSPPSRRSRARTSSTAATITPRSSAASRRSAGRKNRSSPAS